MGPWWAGSPGTLIQVPGGLSPLVRAEVGASAASRSLRGAFLLVSPGTGTVSGMVCGFLHGLEMLTFKRSGFPLLHQPPQLSQPRGC